MKKFFAFSLTALLALPAFAGTTRTTTTRSYDKTTTSPVMGTDMEMNSELESDAEMMESQEEYDDTLEQERMEDEDIMNEEERMEESSSFESEDMIDYKDRTRTDRERKALNTGSDASDDQ